MKPETFADLIEVVLVELKKLKEQDDETTRMVHTLFNDTMSVVNLIEASEKVNLTKVRKGVTAMIDYEARTKQRVEEAVREAVSEASREAEKNGAIRKELELAKKLVESLKVEKPEASYKNIIIKVTSLLGLNQTTVKSLQDMYSIKG